MSRRVVAAAALLWAGACGTGEEARVVLDLAPLWQQSGQTVEEISVRVLDEDDQELGSAVLLSTNDTAELIVRAGPRRRFEVEATFGGPVARIPSYLGERVVDLTAGQELQLVVPVFPAGGVVGTVTVVGAAVPIPSGTVVLATADNPRVDAPAVRRLPIVDGSFSGTLVDGAYTLSVSFDDAGGVSYSGVTEVTVVREQRNDAGAIEVAP